MKKLYLFLFLVVSIFLFNIDVKADTYNLIYNGDSGIDVYGHNENVFYTNIDPFIIDVGIDKSNFETILNTLYTNAINYYNSNFKENYPYYYIALILNHSLIDTTQYYIHLFFVSYVEEPGFLQYHASDSSIDYKVFRTYYDFKDQTFVLPYETTSVPHREGLYNFYYKDPNEHLLLYNPLGFAFSNFNMTFDLEDTTFIVNDYNPPLTLNVGDTVKPYIGYDITDFDSNFNYTEINLNDYAYVALSLKDYNQEPFSTNVKVKGNYCLTPVYNYGMTERKDILTGSQVQRCSPYYDDYTLVRTYITESDLKNNAIYYLKAYDTSKDNYVKVDTSVFDITYITEEEKDNPYVTIGNKTYPTIPYDNLTDTSTKSEDEGYNSGASCAVGDFNCMSSSSSSSFSDLFDKPLEILKTLWSSITNVFGLVTFLISLLPSEMATFLFLGFTIAIVIGLIKMIL